MQLEDMLINRLTKITWQIEIAVVGRINQTILICLDLIEISISPFSDKE